MKKQSRILVLQFTVATVFLASWELFGKSSKDIFFLVGSPSAILLELWDLCTTGNFFDHFTTTGLEALTGLFLGMSLGTAMGLGLWFSDTTAQVARPFIITLGAIPIFALAPLMIVWFGIGFEMKVAIATFSTIFIALSQAYKGANLVSLEYVDNLQAMNASKSQIFGKIILPGCIDWVMNSFRLCAGFALLGAFIGEYISSEKGLGWVILRSSSLYNVPRALAAIVGICLLALALDLIAQLAERYKYTIIRLISIPRKLWSS
jgi:NitT/TauT family transport system permease protein